MLSQPCPHPVALTIPKFLLRPLDTGAYTGRLEMPGKGWPRAAVTQGQLAVVDKHAASSCLTETPSPRGALGGGASVAHGGQLLANIP